MSGAKGRSGGHNKLSIEEHKRRGNYRPGRHGYEMTPPAVPAAAAPAVAKPDRLSAAASVVWDELAPLAIVMGTLTPTDVTAFATLCELQATLVSASARKDGDAAAIRQEREAAAAVRPWLSMFGLTAEGRARLNIVLPQWDPDDAYFAALTPQAQAKVAAAYVEKRRPGRWDGFLK